MLVMWVDVNILSKAEQRNVRTWRAICPDRSPSPDPGRRCVCAGGPRTSRAPAQQAGQIMGTLQLGGGAGRQLLAQGGPAGPAEAAILVYTRHRMLRCVTHQGLEKGEGLQEKCA